MADRSTLDAFEQRIADGLERFVAPATDPKSATEIAAVAMQPRGAVVRLRNVSRPRRFLLLGLAAAFLLPAAYIGSTLLRPPVPEVVNLVQPAPTDDPSGTPGPVVSASTGDVPIFLRRDESVPGVAVYAARPDGSEARVRTVPDSILSGNGTLSEWGTVSATGWLALAVERYGGPWPMVLIDLGDAEAAPWVVDKASTGGIGPRWGPTGLVAADAGSNGGFVVVADPETHSTRTIAMGGLVGGGPSIVWSADGNGIVGTTGNETFQVVPIDGGDPRPGVGQVFDPRGNYGPGMATLRICESDQPCAGGDDGRLERVEADGSTRTVWQQAGADRALGASFGAGVDEYWLSLDHDSGRQVELVHVQGGRPEAVATVNRDATWKYIEAPLRASDASLVLVGIGAGDRSFAVLVPPSGAPSSFHDGHFAGLVDGASADVASGRSVVPAATMPAVGQAYRLPTVEELIAAELALNPGRHVLGKASHDAVVGDTAVRTFEVPRDQPGTGDVYLDCLGPSSATVTSGVHSTTSPCLRAGSYIVTVDESGPVIVTATGDTTWRAILYSQ